MGVVNEGKAAFRSREQMRKFSGIFSLWILKSTENFVGEMLLGIQALQDAPLSEIGRSLRENIKLKRTENG